MNDENTLDNPEKFAKLDEHMARRIDIVKDASAFVTALMKRGLPSGAVYHGIPHIRETVAASREIGRGSRLSAILMENLTLAAWFHDVGYVDLTDGHEERSVEIATRFLTEHNYPDHSIARIAGCIRATKVPQMPKSTLERALCDADIIHIGKTWFFKKSDLLRSEREELLGIQYTDTEWFRLNIDFLTHTRFHTAYARRKYSHRRRLNLEQLRKRFRRARERERFLKQRGASVAQASH
jgi:predicted metal-dependent HD superfamily phosphohydrolase